MTIIGCKSPGCACNLPSSGGRIQGRGSGANTRRSCGEVWLILGMLLCLKKNNMEQTMKIQSNVWKYFLKKNMNNHGKPTRISGKLFSLDGKKWRTCFQPFWHLAGMVWSPAFSRTPWRPQQGAPWRTMGHHQPPQVQQLLQELDTVNGTIRALDEAAVQKWRDEILDFRIQ